MQEKEYTNYAPAGRAGQTQIKKEAGLFIKNKTFKQIADATSDMLVILNGSRQIIFSNKQFSDMAKSQNILGVIGLRPGEAINCIHSHLTPYGCGTTQFCRSCGAVNAILESQAGRQSEKECRIIVNKNDALDLRVKATPFHENGSQFTIFSIIDISNEKRKQNLERVFFHDVLNLAGGIAGISTILTETTNSEEISEIAKTIKQATEHMIEEIQAQQLLTAAEQKDFTPNFKNINTIQMLNNIVKLYSKYEIAEYKNIIINPDSENLQITTDPVILRRIIGNMVKNALEASSTGETIKIYCHKKNNSIEFSVNNNCFINKKIQLQLFKRSFSTKGKGRGLGTYSIKLFGEKYLKGDVWFTSTRNTGTTFFISIPIKIE